MLDDKKVSEDAKAEIRALLPKVWWQCGLYCDHVWTTMHVIVSFLLLYNNQSSLLLCVHCSSLLTMQKQQQQLPMGMWNSLFS